MIFLAFSAAIGSRHLLPGMPPPGTLFEIITAPNPCAGLWPYPTELVGHWYLFYGMSTAVGGTSWSRYCRNREVAPTIGINHKKTAPPAPATMQRDLRQSLQKRHQYPTKNFFAWCIEVTAQSSNQDTDHFGLAPHVAFMDSSSAWMNLAVAAASM